MYKIGLKLWSTNTGAYYTEAQKLYSQGVFDYIELYVLPDSLEHLQKWKALSIPYIIHCPHSAHGFNLANKTLENSNRRIYEQTKQYADELDAQYIIFHGGCDGTIEETINQLSDFKDSRTLIENKPLRPLPSISSAHECRGSSAEELQKVFSGTHCGFCLDIGHAVCAANSLKEEPFAYIKKLLALQNAAIFHLSDIKNMNSELDEHPNLGTGVLVPGKIFSLLPSDAMLTLETNKSSRNSLEDFKADCLYVRKYDLHCRRAELRDSRSIFAISNDPETRRNSFCSDAIPWSGHQIWFERKLNDPECFFYVIENRLKEISCQIRFQRLTPQKYEVSFSLAKEFRGKNLSSFMLKTGMECFRQECPESKCLLAGIKPENISSIKCFARAGFKEFSTDNSKRNFQHEF